MARNPVVRAPASPRAAPSPVRLARPSPRPAGPPTIAQPRMPALIRPGVAAPVAGVRIPQYLTGAQRALQSEAQSPGAFQRVAQTPYGPARVPPVRLGGTGAQRARAVEAFANRPTVPTLVSYPGGGSLYGGTARRVMFPSPLVRRSAEVNVPPAYMGQPAPPLVEGYIPFGGEEGGPPMFGGPESFGGPGMSLPTLPDYYGPTSFRFRPEG